MRYLTPELTPSKRCTKCGELKPATSEHFFVSNRAKSGFQSACKACRKAEYDPQKKSDYDKRYRSNNRQEISRRKKAYYEASRGDKRRRLQQTPEQRFWPKVNKFGPNGCWIWSSTIERAGYGRFYVSKGQRNAMAHRFSYELHYGPIPDGLDCLHRCDNPSCVNPAHLFLGTHNENMADCSEKGRAQKKLTAVDVQEIRRLYAEQRWKQARIAKVFDVDASLVSRIVNRKYWKYTP